MTDSAWLATHWFALVLGAWAIGATLAALYWHRGVREAEWTLEIQRRGNSDLVDMLSDIISDLQRELHFHCRHWLRVPKDREP